LWEAVSSFCLRSPFAGLEKKSAAGTSVTIIGRELCLPCEELYGKRITPNPAAEEALSQALVGPDGAYAAYAEYEAIVQKFGQVQPDIWIIRSEECPIAALKRHLEMRGLAASENPYLSVLSVIGESFTAKVRIGLLPNPAAFGLCSDVSRHPCALLTMGSSRLVFGPQQRSL
jgi:hypothetical protein